MNLTKPLIVLLSMALTGAGCVGTGPNTQQGAVGGALAGAVLGGVIGNNRGSGNAASGAALGAVAGGVAGAALGNSADHQRGTIYGQERSPYDDPRYMPPPPVQAARAGTVAVPTPAPVYGQTVIVPQSQPQVVYVEQPPMPPPPRRDIVTRRPAREAVWVSGYYTYVGRGHYAWVPGHWEVPPGRYTRYDHPRWERRGNGYVYLRGEWR